MSDAGGRIISVRQRLGTARSRTDLSMDGKRTYDRHSFGRSVCRKHFRVRIRFGRLRVQSNGVVGDSRSIELR
jgi:hypothetical protein